MPFPYAPDELYINSLYGRYGNTPTRYTYSANTNQEEKMMTENCTICGKLNDDYTHGDYTHVCRNGVICSSCWPHELSYVVRYKQAGIYKPGEDIPYDISYLIVYTDFPTELLTLKNCPYTIVLLPEAKGTFNHLNHDIHIISTVQSIEFNGINAPSCDMYISPFVQTSIKVRNSNLYILNVEARANCNVSIESSIIANSNMTASGDNTINLCRIDNAKIDQLRLYGLNHLHTSKCRVYNMEFTTLPMWTDNNSIINGIDDNAISFVMLKGTEIFSNLNAKEGAITDCSFTMYQSNDVVVNGGSVKIHTPVYCGLCKDVIHGSEGITIKNKKVHSICWQRDGARISNDTYKGEKDTLPTFSIELELNGTERDQDYTSLLYDLLEYGFIRCSDNTVSDELKSPIFNDLHSFMEVKPLLERAIPYITLRCRTHVHIGASHHLKEMLSYNHNALLSEIGKRFDKFPLTTECVFGCTSSHLCSYYYTGDRFSWLNPATPYQTIEYRLSCLRSWEQFIRLIKFFREFTHWLEERIHNIPTDRYRWTKTKQNLSQKIVDFFIEYIADFDIPNEEEQETTHLELNEEEQETTHLELDERCGRPDCVVCYPYGYHFDDENNDSDGYDPFDFD